MLYSYKSSLFICNSCILVVRKLQIKFSFGHTSVFQNFTHLEHHNLNLDSLRVLRNYNTIRDDPVIT